LGFKKNQVIASLLRFFLKDSTEAAGQRFTAFHERNALTSKTTNNFPLRSSFLFALSIFPYGRGMPRPYSILLKFSAISLDLNLSEPKGLGYRVDYPI
jgi:hypothetical protein